MQRHISRCDWVGLERLAHDMAGVGGGYGFDIVTAIGRELEQAARERPPSIQKLAAMANEFNSVTRRIALGQEQRH